jgi:hypothetical protein
MKGKGTGKKALQSKFNGIKRAMVTRLADRVEKRPEAWYRLTAGEQKALELYFENRLDVSGDPFDRGIHIGTENIIYGQDIRVLDFFASPDAKQFDLITGEGLEDDGWVTVV